MAKYYVLYHEMSGMTRGIEKLDGLKAIYPEDELVIKNVMEIDDYQAFFDGLEDSAAVILAGGDGTINHFANDTASVKYNNSILYYAIGTGNDFLRDIGGTVGDKPICIDDYLKWLPTVTVKGKDYKFINGIGYGIDGYCCEVGDQLKASSDKPVNYTGIAIKGLLFHYKPTNAVITVDGVRHEFKKVWLAPTMNGRFYGGGMNAAPEQNRLNEKHTQSVMLFHGKGRILTLMAFPKIFKGEHVKNKMVTILTGNQIKVEFDGPRALQIDGETITGVTEYEVNAR